MSCFLQYTSKQSPGAAAAAAALVGAWWAQPLGVQLASTGAWCVGAARLCARRARAELGHDFELGTLRWGCAAAVAGCRLAFGQAGGAGNRAWLLHGLRR
jgi:hypothetical protein